MIEHIAAGGLVLGNGEQIPVTKNNIAIRSGIVAFSVIRLLVFITVLFMVCVLCSMFKVVRYGVALNKRSIAAPA